MNVVVRVRVDSVYIAGQVFVRDEFLSLSPNLAQHHIDEGNVVAFVPPYATRKALRDATLRVGREEK